MTYSILLNLQYFINKSDNSFKILNAFFAVANFVSRCSRYESLSMRPKHRLLLWLKSLISLLMSFNIRELVENFRLLWCTAKSLGWTQSVFTNIKPRVTCGNVRFVKMDSPPISANMIKIILLDAYTKKKHIALRFKLMHNMTRLRMNVVHFLFCRMDRQKVWAI